MYENPLEHQVTLEQDEIGLFKDCKFVRVTDYFKGDIHVLCDDINPNEIK